MRRTDSDESGGGQTERLKELVDDGASVMRIAEELGHSPSTIRAWLLESGWETRAARERRRTREAREANDAVLQRRCEHGQTTFVLEGRNYYRCARCRQEAVATRRRRVKQILVEEAGGACAICGYDRCMSALHFHHLKPADKGFGLSVSGVTRSLAHSRKEAQKCILLCSNCHAEVEAGVASIPV